MSKHNAERDGMLDQTRGRNVADRARAERSDETRCDGSRNLAEPIAPPNYVAAFDQHEIRRDELKTARQTLRKTLIRLSDDGLNARHAFFE